MSDEIRINLLSEKKKIFFEDKIKNLYNDDYLKKKIEKYGKFGFVDICWYENSPQKEQIFFDDKNKKLIINDKKIIEYFELLSFDILKLFLQQNFIHKENENEKILDLIDFDKLEENMNDIYDDSFLYKNFVIYPGKKWDGIKNNFSGIISCVSDYYVFLNGKYINNGVIYKDFESFLINNGEKILKNDEYVMNKLLYMEIKYINGTKKISEKISCPPEIGDKFAIRRVRRPDGKYECVRPIISGHFQCSDKKNPHLISKNGFGFCVEDNNTKLNEYNFNSALSENHDLHTKKIFEDIRIYKNMKLSNSQIHKLKNYLKSNSMSSFYKNIQNDEELNEYYEIIKKMNGKIGDIPYSNFALMEYYKENHPYDITSLMSFYM
jgi:hypothetical protein